MKLAARLALLALLFPWISAASAQERDGTVALPGQLRLDLVGQYLRVDSRFGDADAWGLEGPLDRTRLTAIQVPADRFDAFLAATGGADPGGAISGATLSVGDMDFDAVVASRTLPLRVALGIVSRLEIGVSIPMVITQRLVRRLDVAGGNVGLNPNAAENSERLAAIGDAGRELGAATFLPLAGSPGGELLQQRALAATGAALDLPTVPLTATDLREGFDFDRAPYDAGAWEPGDLEVDARFQVMSSFPGLYPVAGRPRDFRVTLHGGYRIAAPFSVEPAEGELRPTSASIGYGGPSAGAVVDLWVGRSWMTLGGRAFRLTRDDEGIRLPAPIELRPGSGIALEAREGDGLELWFVPRIRLTREISLGGMVEGRILSGPTPVGGSGSGDRTLTSAGFSLRFSSLPGMAAGDRMRPIDASVGYLAPISGTDGAQRTGRAFLQLTLLPRLWGGADPVTPPAP